MSSDTSDLRSTPATYILGTSEPELERLGLQHRLWSDAAHALWRAACIQPGSSVLDIGCGPGFATFDLAQIVGADTFGAKPGSVVAVDESPSYLDHLAQQAKARGLACVRTVRADLLQLAQTTDIPDATFDAAYARWVFCFVSDPAAVIKGIRQKLKPGGRLLVQDYFNYETATLAPRRESFTKAVLATAQSWRKRGGDSDIMGRLPLMLQQSGFRISHLAVHQRLARPGETMWQWPQSFWPLFMPVLIEMGLLTKADHEAWLHDWAEFEKTPGAYVVLPPVYELIAEKTSD